MHTHPNEAVEEIVAVNVAGLVCCIRAAQRGSGPCPVLAAPDSLLSPSLLPL